MSLRRLAAIDIGTNTILMLIAEINTENELIIIRDEHSIARLGEGTDRTGIISSEALNRAKVILTAYKKLCSEYEVTDFLICGTSALRDAKNSTDIQKSLSDIIGAEIKIISGEEEARLSYMGTVDDDDRSIVIDIGGGSTEFILGENSKILSRISLPIGAVRITERIFEGEHPPTSDAIFEALSLITSEIEKVELDGVDANIYSVAGTPTTIASISLGLEKYDREKVDGYELQHDSLNKVIGELFESDIEMIVEKYGIDPKRADVITAGAIILSEAMLHLNTESVIVSGKGLRYGILLELYNKIINN
jgi:exopolyphosphatase/guanosine-5'-triphosphate,3'-diphosphate pyrophosphatase